MWISLEAHTIHTVGEMFERLERLSIVLSLKNNIIDQRSSISYIFSIYVAAIPFVLRQINLQLFKALVRSVKKL